MVGTYAVPAGLCVFAVQVQAGVSTVMSIHRGGSRTARIRRFLIERDGNLCRRCGVAIDLRLPGSHMYGPTIGHVEPVSKGGSDYLDNLRLEHRRCNLRAGDRDVPRAAILQASAFFRG